ncbi:flavin reductase family protein [Nocardia rhizosphaerihabitans]|uniref:Oxidoreductase n=1 Tax=Nocardia rhizosphaerihabitans TaxID=1691570 RepID=A0ABQ2KZ95_9NOCA|nr:flavin reductase family protein [Nocardia rhizosphaerihabitans]GGN97749.1 putative oxidoreductase [Nocardia rhizosphaerihabitans]
MTLSASTQGFTEVPTDPPSLRQAFATFPSAVVAVCAQVGDTAHGMAVSTFVPVSLTPPIVSFCVQRTSQTWPPLSRATRLGLSLLGVDQTSAARSLGTKHGDRFRDLTMFPGTDGALLVGGASAWLEATPSASIPAGDHLVVLVHLTRVAVGTEAEPLVFHDSRFRRLHDAK